MSHPHSGKTPWIGGAPLRWTLMEWWFRWVSYSSCYLFSSSFERVNGDGAKPPATRICWTVLSIVEITANASTMMTTQEDWHASVTLDIRSTEYILVWRLYPVPLFTLPKMFYNQVVETWMNVLKEDTNVERTLIASTLMVAIIVSAKLDLKEIRVRYYQEINR